MGAPLVRLPPQIFVVTAHNSGGSTITTITISVIQGPILFGVPLSTPAAVRNDLQVYFASTISDPAVEVATYDDRKMSAISALTANMVDVVQTEALPAFLGYRFFNHQPVAVTAGATGSTSSVLTALVRRSANLTNFEQLKNKRSCNGGFLSPGLYVPISWGVRNKMLEVPADLGIQTLSSCDSPLRNLTEELFSGACAPPDEVGQAGVCGLCPGGFGPQCDRTNKYAGDRGALRGLSDGVCDVAFVKKGTWHNYCSGLYAETAYFPHLEAQKGPPEWCVPFEELTYLEPSGSSKGFGLVPNDVFIIRDGTLTPEQARNFLDALVHVQEPSIFGLGVDSVRAVGSATQGKFSGAPRTYFSDEFNEILMGVPGLEASLVCTTTLSCTLANLSPADKCINAPTVGLRRDNPIKFGLSPRLTAAELARLDNYFSTVRQVTGLSVIGVPTASPGDALTSASVDVVFVNSGEALLAHMEHGHVLVALEGTQDNATLAPQRSIALVRREELAENFSDLRGLRSCHGAFTDGAGMLLPLGWAHSEQLLPSVSTPGGVRVPLGACDSPAALDARAFFGASCAPPASAKGVGLCDLCPIGAGNAVPCDGDNSYAGPGGALRGLADMACEVAFVRNNTWEKHCGGGLPGVTVLEWCLPEGNLRALEVDFGSVPADGFLVRMNSMDVLTLQLTQRMLGALNHQPALLGILQLTGVSEAIAPGSASATQTHLEPLRAQLLDYGLPGFATSIECLEGASSSSLPSSSSTPSNMTRCRSPPPRKPCENYLYPDMSDWELKYDRQYTDLGSVAQEIT
jgi:ABC-type phosphate/phosphonate transport system substrate-binding protein